MGMGQRPAHQVTGSQQKALSGNVVPRGSACDGRKQQAPPTSQQLRDSHTQQPRVWMGHSCSSLGGHLMSKGSQMAGSSEWFPMCRGQSLAQWIRQQQSRRTGLWLHSWFGVWEPTDPHAHTGLLVRAHGHRLI